MRCWRLGISSGSASLGTGWCERLNEMYTSTFFRRGTLQFVTTYCLGITCAQMWMTALYTKIRNGTCLLIPGTT